MLRRIANVVEAVVAIVFVVTVVLLFTNAKTERPPAQAAVALDAYGRPVGTQAEGSAVPAGPDGAAIYDDNCSACHGPDGGGGMGPALADGAVVASYPDVADQIAIVTRGQGEMPSFSERGLTAEEIAAVVEFTRTSLSEG